MDIIERRKDIFFFLVITVLGVAIRIPGRNFISKDMYVFLNPWFHTIKELGGFGALSTQVGDYNILYQTIIAFLTYIDIDSVISYKIVSSIFDFLLAYYCAVFLCELSGCPKYKLTFNCAYSLVLFLPTVIFNSSFWGQCDAMYLFFCILTLRNLYRQKYLLSFIFLGLAFAFKLQAVFIVPFIVCYYFYKREFSILYFFISALILELSGIPGFLAGRRLFAPWEVYLFQTKEQPVMYANIPNLWALTGGDYETLGKFAIIFTICILGIGLYLVLSKKKELLHPEDFLNFACWSCWTCVLFLPVMHERYTYGLDILLLLLCFLNKIYIPFALTSGILSLLSYSYFLFDTDYAQKPAALSFLAAYLIYTCIIFLYRVPRQSQDPSWTPKKETS